MIFTIDLLFVKLKSIIVFPFFKHYYSFSHILMLFVAGDFFVAVVWFNMNHHLRSVKILWISVFSGEVVVATPPENQLGQSFRQTLLEAKEDVEYPKNVHPEKINGWFTYRHHP